MDVGMAYRRIAEVARRQGRIPGSAPVESQADAYPVGATHPEACARISQAFVEMVSGRRNVAPVPAFASCKLRGVAQCVVIRA
jgi:hypothetical protein